MDRSFSMIAVCHLAHSPSSLPVVTAVNVLVRILRSIVNHHYTIHMSLYCLIHILVVEVINTEHTQP